MQYDYNYMKTIFKNKGYILLDKEYKNLKQKVNYICERHKDFGIQTTTYAQAISYEKQCRVCKNKEILNRSRYNIALKEKVFIELCHNKNLVYQGFLVNEFKSVNIYYICKVHYEKGIQHMRDDHLKRGVGCPYCANKIITTDDLKNDPRIKNIEILGEYERDNKKIKCKCLKCGKILYITPNHLKNGKGCKYCHSSKGEERIEEILTHKNIKFVTQFCFKGCVNIKPLRFDFYLPDYNICIEYNGVQHYKPIERFGGIDSFKEQQIRDNIKRKYCKENNIKLIEIPYTKFKNIENILNDMLKSLETAGN